MTPVDVLFFQLRFRSLYCPGRGFAFPCDAQGHVDIEHLSAHARESYLRASALVGRELSLPTVEATRRRSVLPVLAL